MSYEQMNAYATIATAIAAFFALIGAAAQLIIGRHEARMALAKSIYKDYLLLAFENPKFSSPSYPVDAPRMRSFENNWEEFEKYEFFVSHLLYAAELILERTTNDPEWRNTLRDQLKYHALYIDSTTMPESHYSSPLHTLREEAIAAYNEDRENNR